MLKEVDLVYKAIRTRRFNQKKPIGKKLLEKVITSHVQNGETIPIVSYWGIGNKNEITSAETETLNFLNEFRAHMNQKYEHGIKFHFVISTPHARFNGYEEEQILRYKDSVQKLFDEYDLEYSELEKYWERHNISVNSIKNEVQRKGKDWWNQNEYKAHMEKNAKGQPSYLKYGSNLAQYYYVMREKEKKIFESEFREYVFFSFTQKLPTELLPNLPVLFLFSTKGKSNSPWFEN